MRQRKSVVLGMSYVFVFTCGLTVGMFTLSGCGGDDAGGDDAATTTDGAKSTATDSSGSTKVAANGLHYDENGRQVFADGFPLDSLYFPDPLTVARQEGKVVDPDAGDPGTTSENGSENPATPMPTSDSGSGEINWKEVIAISVLEDEMKKITNRFRSKLLTVATFNSGFFELPPHAAAMAALSGIAARHPDDIRWKKNANQIRDLAASMVVEKLQRGPKSYKQFNEPFLSISDILSGSPPGGLPEPDADASLADYADIGLMMKRLNIGKNWMQVNVGTEAALKENAEEIKHEVAVLAALLTVTTTEGYGFADNDEFKAFAKEMIDNCKKVAEAAETGSFDNYQIGFSQMNQACDKCHTPYR